MYDLYYAAGACSMAVHVVLNELDLEHIARPVDMAAGEHKTPEYLSINPRGQVGTLVTPQGIMTENAAMIVYLNDTHGGDLIPSEGYERALALQWLMYANSTLHPAYAKVMFSMKNGASDDVIKSACDGVQDQWDLIEKQLEESGGPFLMDDHFSAGDIYVAVVANWQFIPHLPTFGPKTKAYLETVTSRSAYQRTIEAEQIEYKALAA